MRRVTVAVLTLCALVFVVAACSKSGGGSGSSGYPKKPITLIVPFTAGSAVDIHARLLARYMKDELGQPVTVLNQPGGGAGVALGSLESRPADGYTLMMGSDVLEFSIVKKTTKFTVDDLDFIAKLSGEPTALIVKKSSPIKSLQDFVAYAKAHPKVTVGGSGSGTHNELVDHQFEQVAGITTTWVPYSGGSDAVVALLGGKVTAIMEGASSAQPQVDAGQVRVLGVTTDSPYGAYPSMKSAGYPVIAFQWHGIVARAGTPDAVKTKLIEALKKIENSAAWKSAYLTKYGQQDLFAAGEEFRSEFEKDLAVIAK